LPFPLNPQISQKLHSLAPPSPPVLPSPPPPPTPLSFNKNHFDLTFSSTSLKTKARDLLIIVVFKKGEGKRIRSVNSFC
jgi:hypothetical protein